MSVGKLRGQYLHAHPRGIFNVNVLTDRLTATLISNRVMLHRLLQHAVDAVAGIGTSAVQRSIPQDAVL